MFLDTSLENIHLVVGIGRGEGRGGKNPVGSLVYPGLWVNLQYLPGLWVMFCESCLKANPLVPLWILSFTDSCFKILPWLWGNIFKILPCLRTHVSKFCPGYGEIYSKFCPVYGIIFSKCCPGYGDMYLKCCPGYGSQVTLNSQRHIYTRSPAEIAPCIGALRAENSKLCPSPNQNFALLTIVK